MKKLLLRSLLLTLFFFASTKTVLGVTCQANPKEGYIGITNMTLECVGAEPNRVYAASFYIPRTDGYEPKSYTHCGRATQVNNPALVNLVINFGPFYQSVTYHVDIKYSGPGCTSGTIITRDVDSFKILESPTTTSKLCDPGYGAGPNAGLDTAIGCLPVKPELFATWFLQKAIGLGGGIAFLLIIWGTFQIITSSGNPEKLGKGKDTIVSALTGLLMIIFSIVLLKIIGVDILAIPGFGQ